MKRVFIGVDLFLQLLFLYSQMLEYISIQMWIKLPFAIVPAFLLLSRDVSVGFSGYPLGVMCQCQNAQMLAHHL